MRAGIAESPVFMRVRRTSEVSPPSINFYE